ncbi:MAG: flavodoxin family protein [Actinomycetota bacterium]|nr:flavodoxin family protein [Actinomycetota bacterium]
MRVLAIIGSPNKNGNSARLLRLVLKKIGTKYDTEELFLKDFDLNPCDGCHYCEKKNECVIEDDMQKIYKKMKKADVLILSTPSYMGGPSSRLRIFMERTWHLRKGHMENKLGSYIITGRRKIGPAALELQEYLLRLKLRVVPGVLGFGFSPGEVLKDKEAIKEVEMLAERLI